MTYWKPSGNLTGRKYESSFILGNRDIDITSNAELSKCFYKKQFRQIRKRKKKIWVFPSWPKL